MVKRKTQTDCCKTLAKKIKNERGAKIDAILASMETWDPEEVLRWAQHVRLDILKGLSAEDLYAEYEEACVPD